MLESKDLSQFRGYAQEEIGEGWSLDGKYLYFDGSGGGDVITREVYDNFDLQVEWKVADGANSGIMYRVSLGDGAPYMSGPEYQILDDGEHEDGKNELTAAGSLYGMFAAKDKTLREVGSWNKTRIIVDGDQVTHFLNGKKVLEAEIGGDDWNKQLGESKFKDWEKFAKNKEGHIAFQDHGNEVWFRNIRIKRLGGSEVADNDEPVGRPGKSAPARQGSKRAMMAPPESGPESDTGKGGGKPGKSSAPRQGSKRAMMAPPESGPESDTGKGGKPGKSSAPRQGSKRAMMAPPESGPESDTGKGGKPGKSAAPRRGSKRAMMAPPESGPESDTGKGGKPGKSAAPRQGSKRAMIAPPESGPESDTGKGGKPGKSAAPRQGSKRAMIAPPESGPESDPDKGGKSDK